MGGAKVRAMLRIVGVLAVGLIVAACGGGGPTATIGPVTLPQTSAAASASAIGGPISGLAQIGNILTPADFAAVGVSGTGTPTVNHSGNAGYYIVYAKLSAADGGVELDIFPFATPADALLDFGDISANTLDSAGVAQIGADQAGFYVDQAGNQTGLSYDEIRVLKGKVWFNLDVPSNPNSRQQLNTLAALVVARGAAIF